MKRRFEFRLARVLRVRSVTERVARAAWSGAEQRASDSEAQRRQLSDGVARARGELTKRLTAGTTDPGSVLLDQASIDHQLDVLGVAGQTARTQRAQAESLRRAWTERERERRGLSELEARARSQHRRDLEARENAELDALATARSAWRARRGMA